MEQISEELPLVTVYIPTYNRAKLLQRAVDSVRKQTYQNLEIIIVDDFSTDNTQEYLQNLVKEDSRVSYYIKESNSGACVSRNIAINNAKGVFITGLDDDDYFKENRIEVFVKEAKKNRNQIYFTNSDVISHNGYIKKPNKISILKPKSLTHNDLLKVNYIGNQIFVKTSLIKNSGGFDENLKAWQDLECWYNLMKSQNIKASWINQPTQVLDISHPHERITTKSLANVLTSLSYIEKKHHLNSIERFYLKGQLIQYAPDKFNFHKKLIYLITTKNLYILKSILNLK